MVNYIVTQYVNKYMKVGDDFQRVEVTTEYVCESLYAFETLIMTLVGCKEDEVKFSVVKKEATI